MTPTELAVLYLDQLHAYREGVPAARPEPNALFVWEELICDDPEQAWPVFEEVLQRTSDDETLEQVGYRLRLLLDRHYDSFHERAATLLARFKRFWMVAGPDALDPAQDSEKPFDREALIGAYRTMVRTFDLKEEVDRLAHTDPERALAIAVEIIHRGAARGWDSFDVMAPLGDVLAAGGHQMIGQVEEYAKQSVAVRRVLWRLQRQADLSDPLERAMGTTTDYTEIEVPVPAAQRQLDADERIIEGWLEHQESFWAFSALSDLCDDDPRLAWSIALELIARTEDPLQLAAIAAGPLEDLIRKHSGLIWPELTAHAHTDPHFLSALRCVWVFEDDGDVYHRFRELMETIELEPN